MIRAALFDVGGPINTEVTLDRQLDVDIRAELAAAGVAADDEAYADACRFAVDSFAANAYQAIIWYVTGLLADLHARGVRLGLAANQSRRTVLFRTGRHRAQLPRSWLEVPDAEVHNVDELHQTLPEYLKP